LVDKILLSQLVLCLIVVDVKFLLSHELNALIPNDKTIFSFTKCPKYIHFSTR